MTEQIPTNASDPSTDVQPRPSDPVSRLAALTQRPATTSIFGRRSAPQPEATPSEPAPAADTTSAPHPATSIFGRRTPSPAEEGPAETGPVPSTEAEGTASASEPSPSEPASGAVTTLTPMEEALAQLTDAIVLPPTAPAPPSPEPWEALAPDPGQDAQAQATTTPRLGRLAAVSAGDLWDGTAAMSAWLSDEPEALAEALGLTLRDVTVTAPGRVRGVAASDASPVSIVCEVGPSSDEAFAALLATASLQDGGTVVWIAGEPDVTHGATLSWLNRSTSPRFLFVKAAGVRIGESAAAPTFEIVVRPSRATDGVASDPNQASQGASAGRRAEDHEGD